MSAAVLIVDDEAIVRNFVTRVLHAHGYSVYIAANREEVVRVLAAAPPLRLLITDVNLEGATGAEVAALAAAAVPGLRVLYMSGDAVVGWADGPAPSAFLAKPFDAEGLLSSVRSLVG